MPEYWKKVHNDALAGMQGIIDKLTKDHVEDDCADMECALGYVLKHGTCKMKAKAIGYFNDFKWATHEKAAHAAAKGA